MKYLTFIFLLFLALPCWSTTARQYYEEALQEKDLKKQIELYTKAINKAPKFISAYHRRGDVYKEQGKIKRPFPITMKSSNWLPRILSNIMPVVLLIWI